MAGLPLAHGAAHGDRTNPVIPQTLHVWNICLHRVNVGIHHWSDFAGTPVPSRKKWMELLPSPNHFRKGFQAGAGFQAFTLGVKDYKKKDL